MTEPHRPDPNVTGGLSRRRAVQLAALIAIYALSQAFRTIAAVTALAIGREFELSMSSLGLYAAAFHLAFAAAQVPVGLALDRYGPFRTTATFSVAAIVGVGLSAMAPNFATLVAGQALIGIGCAPALMATMVLVGSRWPANEFAWLSGIVIALGNVGLLLTASPLAWVIEHGSWRLAFVVVGALFVVSVVACYGTRPPCEPRGARAPDTLGASLHGLSTILRQRQTAGILAFGFVTYAAVISLRGLWVVPFLTTRHGLDLVQAGHAAVGLSVGMGAGALLFGWLDPGRPARRPLMAACALLMAACLVVLGHAGGPLEGDIAVIGFAGLISSFYVLQYADVRSAYPPAFIGRALAALNLSVFAGVATLQWLSGISAEWAIRHGLNGEAVAFSLLAGALVAGTVAFRMLPAKGDL